MELKKLIEANPLFRDKLIFPALKASRLRTLINQRWNFNVYGTSLVEFPLGMYVPRPMQVFCMSTDMWCLQFELAAPAV